MRPSRSAADPDNHGLPMPDFDADLQECDDPKHDPPTISPKSSLKSSGVHRSYRGRLPLTRRDTMAPMPLEPPIPVDTRTFFRPVSTSLVDLLRGLSRQDWERPTVARQW